MPACTDPTIGFTVFSEQLLVVMVIDVDHGDNVDGVDEFSVKFLSHNAYQAEH